MLSDNYILDDEFVDIIFSEFEASLNEPEGNPDTNLLANKNTLVDDVLDNDEFFALFETCLDENEKEETIVTNRSESDFKVLTYKKVDYYIPRIVISFPIPVYDHLKQVGVIYQNDINNIQFSVNESV